MLLLYTIIIIIFRLLYNLLTVFLFLLVGCFIYYIVYNLPKTAFLSVIIYYIIMLDTTTLGNFTSTFTKDFRHKITAYKTENILQYGYDC